MHARAAEQLERVGLRLSILDLLVTSQSPYLVLIITTVHAAWPHVDLIDCKVDQI